MIQSNINNSTSIDLIIIGASAAGISAAIYASRREIKFRLISQDIGGEVARSGKIGNWLGINETDGITLSNQFKAQLDYNKVDYQVGVSATEITKIEGSGFAVTTEIGTTKQIYQTKAVLIATGVHPRELTVEGEPQLRNKGISYCTTCDGPLYKNKIVATIGGGNSGLESALMMKEIATKVYLLTINDKLAGESVYIHTLEKSPNVEIIYNADTKQFIPSTDSINSPQASSGQAVRLGALEYSDKKTGQMHKIEVQGAFIHIGVIPNSAFLPTDIKKDQFGQVIVNQVGETNIPGIFAAGDVTDIPFKQIAIAAGQGVSAVLRAIQYFDQQKK